MVSEIATLPPEELRRLRKHVLLLREHVVLSPALNIDLQTDIFPYSLPMWIQVLWGQKIT